MSLVEFAFKIYQDITGSDKSFLKKFYIYILIIFGLYVADNIIGFSYYQSVSSKIEKTKEINSILKDSAVLSKSEITKLKLLRSDIINRKTIKDNVYSFFSNISFISSKNPITTKPIETNPIIERNPDLHFYTSSASILLIMIIFFFAGLIDRQSPLPQKIITIIVIELILYPFAFLFSKVLYLIPVINEKPTINYVLNVVLSFLIPYLLYYIPTKLNKKYKY
jgi:hypothetical protein